MRILQADRLDVAFTGAHAQAVAMAEAMSRTSADALHSAQPGDTVWRHYRRGGLVASFAYRLGRRGELVMVGEGS